MKTTKNLVKTLPVEIWYEILKYIDIITLSNLICTNKFFNIVIDNNFWYLIDNIIDYNNFDYTLIPATIHTFNKYTYLIDWNSIILYNQTYANKTIPESTVVWIPDNKDLQIISTCQTFSDTLIRQIFHKINYKILLSTQTIPTDILYNIIETNTLSNQEWYYIWSKHIIDYNFVLKYIDNVQWHPLSSNKNIVCYEIIMNYGENIIWQEFTKHSINENILQSFIHKFDFICWNNISRFTELSETFIKTNFQHFELGSLIRYQCLSENLLNDIVSKFSETDFTFNFTNILRYQKVSKKFLLTYNIYSKHELLRSLVKNKRIPRSLIHDLDQSDLINKQTPLI
jgi:hypothetical protein